MRNVFFTVLAIVFAAGVAVLALGELLVKAVPAKLGATPPDLGAQSVKFRSESGGDVRGWWCPVPEARGSLLLLPGVRANRLSMVERARFLRSAGFSVLLIDFQATGETPGDHITFGWRESRDVLAAVALLRRTAPKSKVGVIGSSLGGAAALLATPPLQVGAMVLEAVYPTIERATDNRLRKYLGPAGPWLTKPLLWQAQLRLGLSAEQLRPVDHIAAVRCPVLIINGAADQNTRPEDARLLFNAAKSPRELWLVPKKGHVDLHRAAKGEYEARVGASSLALSRRLRSRRARRS